MTHFVKLYSSILDSTIWAEPATTVKVWLTLLAMADPNGFVDGAMLGVMRRAIVSREECETAIRVLESPDPDSKTPDHEGRRIERKEGGWQILNHRKYRDLRTETQIATAQRVKQYRDKAKTLHVTDVTNVTRRNGKKHDVRTEVEVEVEVDTTKTKDPRVARVLTRYKEIFPDSRISFKSAGKIIQRAPRQFNGDELVEAIEGNAADPWHRDRGKHELSYVLRNEEKIEYFRNLKRMQQTPQLVGVGGDLTVEELDKLGIRL